MSRLSWRRLLVALISLYPTLWRERYGDETKALVDDLLTAAHPKRARLALNLLGGAVKERLRPTVRPAPAPLPPPAFQLWCHRDLFGRTRVDVHTRALLEPGEKIVGTFDAVTGYPRLRVVAVPWIGIGSTWLLFSLVSYVFFATHGEGGYRSFVDAVGPALGVAPFGILGLGLLAFSRLRGARPLMFALTSQGLVGFEMDWRRRPQRIVSRSPAVAPQVIRRRRGVRQVALGETVVWVPKGLDPLMAWMSGDGIKAG